MLSYVNLDNGKTYYACQDPLCSHTPDSQCNYLCFFQYESLNNSIFATRQNITTYRYRYNCSCGVYIKSLP